MDLAIITLFTLFGVMVGTLAGFGSATILVPVVALFLPLPQTMLLVGMIHWLNSLWKIALFKKGVRWNLIIAFGVPGILLTYLGARLVFIAPAEVLGRTLGAFLAAYAVFLLRAPNFKVPRTTTTAVVGGSLSGFAAGIFGIGGGIRSAFLAIYALPKEVYLATAGAIAIVVDTVRVATYFMEGARLPEHLAWGMLVIVPASVIGAKAAQRIVSRIPQKKFRVVIAVFLFLFGAKMLIWP